MTLRLALVIPLIVAAARSCGSAPPATFADADVLRRSVGVNLHLEYDGTPYGDLSATRTALRFLAVTEARDAALRSGPEGLSRFAKIAEAGVHLDLFVSRDIPAQLASLRTLAVHTPGAVASIEGPNEANHEPFAGGVVGDVRAVQAFQARLYRYAHSTPGIAALPVASFTYWPPLGGQADMANFHAYPSISKAIAPQLAWQRRLAAAVQPQGSPIVCTETGFTTGGANPISEAQQAELEPILLLENFRAGVRRTYLYELFDERDDHRAASPDRENHWGLFRNDGQPKPAAYTIHRFMTLLQGEQSSTPTRPTPRNWVTLSGRALRVLRVQREDGVRLSFTWWPDAVSEPHRPVAVSSHEGVQVVDLASGRETSLPSGLSQAPSGASPLVFVQMPVRSGHLG